MKRTLAQELMVDTKPPSTCKMCRYLQGATDDDRAALLSALADPTVTHIRIAGAMTAVGFSISETSVRRHRRVCHDTQGSAEQP